MREPGHRVNCNFPVHVYETLEELARRKGTTLVGVLREAVAVMKWMEDERAAGARIISERTGEKRELWMP